MAISTDLTRSQQIQLSPAKRIWSLIELFIGSLIVIGHNVLHILPNEVPILFVVGLISLQVRDGNWRAAGFYRPNSWWRTVLIAVCVAALLQLKSVVMESIEIWIWGRPPQISHVFQNIASVKTVLKALGLVWTFAAFGEEVAYRGYLLKRAADVGNWSRTACVFALLWSSTLFGFGHYYKGPSGVLESTVSGLILGSAYLLTKRVLWAPIFAHGLSDTFAVVATYFRL
jgi:membrane protease YdiL (CAAX protease family)